MKRKFTFLIAAAVMLLTMMATTGTMWGQTRAEVTDVMNQSWTGVTGTSYSSVTGLEGSASDAVYSVQCAGGNSSIQLRSKNNNSGIVTTTTGGTATKVVVTWNSSTQSGNKLDVYGKNTAYSAPSDLYGSSAGTLIGSIVCGTSTELTITDSYTFIGMRSNNGAIYLTEIDVTWETGGGSGDLENSDLAITGTPVALNFDLYNNSSAQVIHYTTSSTGTVTVSESEYVTTSVDETNKTITVTPTAVTPSPQTITISQAADDTYKAGSVTFTVTITDSTPIPTYTVTLGDDNSLLTEETGGAGVTLPTRSSLNGYDFAGWSETNVNPETTTAPTIIAAGEYHPTADITLYPVYSKTIGGGGSTNANASVTIANYASAHNWTNGVAYQPLVMDDYVSVGGTISGNNFKYYTSDNTWRFYTDGSFTISTSNNATLTSFTLTIPSGTLTYNDNTITSNTPVNVNGSTATINCTANAKITAIAVSYTIPGSGTTYYWSSPVAATVETPAIVIAENPFYFSTTATITCATDGAAIKYSFDGENWSSYSAALTITETTTIYAKAIKDEIESTTAYITATKNLAVPTVTIDATNITNTDVFTGTAAGSLSASITYNEVAIEGATVTWSGDADAVATIDASTGAVTLVAAGSVTFTATYAGNGDYSEKTATYQMTVTNTDPNIPGSQNNPYTVAQARAAIDAGTGVTGVYATGIVSEIVTPYSSQYHNISYNISSDGLTTNDQLQAYRGKSYNGANFTSEDDIQVGDIVVVYGNLKKYNDIYEFDANNQLVSLIRKVATPTFSPIAGDVAAGTEVTIACATNGATIYYTTDGTDPTTSSNVYSEPILVNAAITIKAFAWKDGSPSSDIVTAEYTIAAPVATPTFSVSEGTYNFAQSVEIECTTEGATIYYTTDGNDPTTESTEYTEAIVVNETMTIKAIGAKAGLANSEVASATYTMNIPVINASNVNLAYDATNGSIAYTLTNEVEGGVLTAVRTEGDWLTVGEVSVESVALTCTANEGEADRTATVTLTYNYETHTVTKVVTVTQAHFIVDYATLPFEFDGGYADIESIVGLTQEGIDSKDYSSSPKLKFNNTDDWLILKINERPGTLTFDIKGNTFSGGTFTVQTSENGETYTDLATYTELGSTTQSESFDNLGENVRYIKWIYTNKDAGNVALGNIALAAYQEQVATPTFTPAAGEYSEAQSVTIACETEGATIYYKTAENAEWAIYSEAINIAETTTIWAYAAKEGMNNSAVATATYTINIPVLTASITVYPLNIEATAAETVDWLAITLENIDITEDGGGEFDLVFCDNDGNPLSEKPAWFEFDFSFNDVWSMPYTILANTETTARTLYFKIYGLGDDGETEAYSDLVTVTQAGYVVDYAELPFEWEGGASADLLALTGVSASQLSGDYASGHAPYLIKFDNTGKYIQVKTDSQPGVVTIGVKMIGGDNTSTITVQGSVDGETFDDGEALEISGNQNDIVNLTSTRTFGENVRYVRLYFTKGSNVGVGPIMIAQVDNTPAITLSSYSIEAPAEPEAPATEITGSLTVTLNNITIEDLDQLGVDFCDENGELLSGPDTKPNWFDAEFELVNEEYKLNYTIQPSDVTEERIAYFKVFEVDSEAYSNLVTVTQEALVASITVDPDFVEAEANETEDYLGITLTNIVITDEDNFDVYFCDEEGNIITDQNDKPDWLIGEVQLENNEFSLYYMIDENIYPEERIAYMKVYGMGDNGTTEAYSNIVTVTQAAAEYTVTFKVDDCTHGDTTGSSINLPTESTCTPDGFAIYGWALQNSIEAVANPYMPTADVTLYAILQLENVPSVMEKYVKVTEELTDWSGEYLIVYEAGNLAFDGSLTTLDAAQNTIEVTITNNTIEAYSTTDASKFTIAAYNNGYSIQSASGYYIGQTSDANGLSSSTETVYENAISYDTENECVDLVSSSTHLRYNTASNQERFRYYKSASYTNQQAIQLYKKTSEATTPTIVNVEYVSDTTEITDTIPASTSYVVESGAVLTFTGTNEGTAANLVVQEGGQLIHTADVEATVQKSVSGYNSKSGDGWYLISSPVDNLPTSSVATGTYDLFAYDEATAYWWVDHAITGQPANHTFTTLERGKGYLYANEANVNLNYAGTMKATNANITVDLSYACDEYPDLKGFNLVGNPFTRNITAADMVIADMVIGDTAVTSYYDFNADRTEFVTYLTNDRPIQPGQGFFIQATAAGQKLVFNPAKSKDASDFKYISISAGDENFTDKAYIQFGYGNTLRKMTFGENTMVYVMNDDLDYAAARVEELAGTMPVHFVPIEDGFYTITVETKNIENLNYMHLIDNIKNTEIDLLVEPSYTFKASESDNADRFHLVFDFNNYTGVNENYTNDNFAHQIGDEIFVSGEGTLQVFDVLGRFVTGYNVNGDKRISTAEFNTGVYIFRMVGTEVKTQKIIVR